MNDYRPVKCWRVSWKGANSADYRSKRGAYNAVKSLTDRRLTVTVHRWENGSWRLYERCEPVQEDGR